MIVVPEFMSDAIVKWSKWDLIFYTFHDTVLQVGVRTQSNHVYLKTQMILGHTFHL